MSGKENPKSSNFALLKRRKEVKEDPHLVANGRRRKRLLCLEANGRKRKRVFFPPSNLLRPLFFFL